jgi:hypothetical protein
MGLSNRKRTNRRFNGTKMVVNNTGTASTIVPKNDFSQTNQYNQISPNENNFIPCTTDEGLYNPNFVYQQTGSVNVCLDVNPFYGKNKLMIGRTIGLTVVNSESGELIYNNDELKPIFSISQLPINQYMVTGNFTGFVKKINSDLTEDNSFVPRFQTNKFINKSIVKFTPDNKILLYMRGNITPFKIGHTATTIYYQQIYKLNTDGTIDTDFFNQTIFPLDSNTQFFPASTAFVYDIEIVPSTSQEFYKIYIVGKFNEYQEVSTFNFCSIDQNGQIDDEMNSPFSNINDYVTSIKYVNNGKLLIGGFFEDIQGYNYLLRYDVNLDGGVGDVDITFTKNNIPGPVTSIQIDTDNKILVSYNNLEVTGTTNYIRLNFDGSTDNTFNVENFIPQSRRLSSEFIYKSSNGGYFLRQTGDSFENGVKSPTFMKLKGC